MISVGINQSIKWVSVTLIHAFQRMFSLLTVKVEDEDEFLIYLIPQNLLEAVLQQIVSLKCFFF